MSQMVTISGSKLLRHSDTKVGITNASIPEVNMLKNCSILAVSAPINISVKLGFVSVNGFRKLSLWTRYTECIRPPVSAFYLENCMIRESST